MAVIEKTTMMVKQTRITMTMREIVVTMALKEIARSRQKRPHWVRHVFVCQRLLWQEEWRRRFEKEMDFWCFVWPGAEVWRPSNFEPLLLGISFPMNRGKRPWLVRERGDAMVEAGRALSKVSRSCNLRLGDHLRELWERPWDYQPLRGGVVR